MKQELFDVVERASTELNALADYIYDCAECGCEEFKSQDALCSYLETHEFKVERGIGGLKTAFHAVYKSLEGGVRIGLLCEYDALYGIGHACGHHMQGPSALGAAFALKKCLGGRYPFTLVVYGCPDEEGYANGGKQVMIENGCFNDIDLALIMHGGTETTTDLRTLAAVRYDLNFSNPRDPLDKSCDSRAVDAMLAAFEGTEFLREHIIDDARIHYTYWVNDRDTLNSCHAEYSVRAKTLPYFAEMKQRFLSVVNGAAKMMGASVTCISGREYLPKIPIQTVVDSFYENAKLAGAERIEGARKRVGSSDTANVLFKVPGVGIRIAFAPKGTSAHSRDWLLLGKSESAHRAVIVGAKTMAGIAYDFIECPEKLKRAREEHKRERARLMEISENS